MNSHQLFTQIRQRLYDKVPTSVVRCGDGEAMVLNGNNDHPSLDWVCKRQLGYMPELSRISEIQQYIVSAYQSADFIGVPEAKRNGLNEYWYRCLDILFENIGEVEKEKLTTVDFHNEWLENNLLSCLLEDAERIVYISCRDLDSRFKHRYSKEIHSFHIAPEIKFTPSYTGPRHYPDQFNHIQRWMDSVPVEGSLCLVGAGFVGKVYNKWFKERGGISLDIGNVFDLFAGLATRGKNRGVGVINETYKL